MTCPSHDRCWIVKKTKFRKSGYSERFIGLTPDALTFYKKENSPWGEMSISCKSIDRAEEVESKDKKYFCLKIITKATCEAQENSSLVLAFDYKEVRNYWLNQLNSANGYDVIENSLKNLSISPNQIEMEEKIGEGAYGVVWRGKFAGSPVAVKELTSTMRQEQIMAEIELLSKINHPNCVRLLGFYREGTRKLFIVTELVENGDLTNIIYKRYAGHQLSQRVKLLIMRDISFGMSYLHENGVIHRDLKADNCLIRSVSESALQFAVIADFGVSKLAINQSREMTIGVGTPVYMAPDCFEKDYTEAVDVYSFGILMNEVFSESKPWSHVETKWTHELFDKAEAGERPLITFTQEQYPDKEDIVALIKWCWDPLAKNRPSMSDITAAINEILNRSSTTTTTTTTARPPSIIVNSASQSTNITPGRPSEPTLTSSQNNTRPPTNVSIAPSPSPQHNSNNYNQNNNNNNNNNNQNPHSGRYASNNNIHNNLSNQNVSYPQNYDNNIRHSNSNNLYPPNNNNNNNSNNSVMYPPNNTLYPPNNNNNNNNNSNNNSNNSTMYNSHQAVMPPPLSQMPSWVQPIADSHMSSLPPVDIGSQLLAYLGQMGGSISRYDFQTYLNYLLNNYQDAASFANSICYFFKAEYITKEYIERLLGYFHPIVSHSGLTIAAVNMIFGCGFFKGFISGNEAESRLRGGQPGYYLVRFSSIPGALSLEVLDNNAACIHLKVEIQQGGGISDSGVVHNSFWTWLSFRALNPYHFASGNSAWLSAPCMK